MPYAEQTQVSPERSQQEIAGLVRKYGATQFMSGWQQGRALVGFIAPNGRQVRFILPLPTDIRNYRLDARSRIRTDKQAQDHLDQEIRRRWRSLALVIKAKLDAVETGIVTFDEEFATHIVMPDGRTVAEHILPAIEAAYETGEIGPLLPDYGLPALTAGAS